MKSFLYIAFKKGLLVYIMLTMAKYTHLNFLTWRGISAEDNTESNR